MTTVNAPPTGDLPIRDSAPLAARISRLDADQEARLRETWTIKDFGGLDPLLTTADYIAREAAVDAVEGTATGPEVWQRLKVVADQLSALPEHIRTTTVELLQVYAGMADPRTVTITGHGRLAEAERIVAEAVAAAAEDPGIPSVTELPPVQDTGDLDAIAASSDHPGPKAKAAEVMAWVGQDRNRAARAWMHEHERSTPRKGVVSKLSEVLGPDGVALVEAEIAKHQPPPMDLSVAPAPRVPEDGAEAECESASDAGPVGEGRGDEPPAQDPPTGDVADGTFVVPSLGELTDLVETRVLERLGRLLLLVAEEK